ncbi:AbrB/MazE/SpoVT family DNA-binding domain-containing protein [Jiella avicenniae]|uniref:AbrB/MazE/SpoVT family DNA-binding domain-containing protein n=1 Tax=Jiella avicenniae TaxID=2907202 RepID=A0A9X1NZ16_9HYPH|nr:AbrB/MazE/SpoVT family DNA-binding domain-containing protein [Jiella avicenniae]MCE7026764.1 AbrB/MazE/SpoVT family DNA-binding domain-containing protein [Jiella avicenniae]
MFEVIVDAEGRVTIPKPIRDTLHLEAGDRLAFVEVDGSVVLQPRNGSVAAIYGALSSYAIPETTLDDYDAAVGEGISDHVEGREKGIRQGRSA